MLWTPPYTPDLQPIETYWGIAKNRVATRYFAGRTMKETVNQLREGWHGNAHRQLREATETQAAEKPIKAIDCGRLIVKSQEIANNRFIPMCNPRLSGTLGNLQIGQSNREGTAMYPIDLIVADFADLTAEDNDTGG